MSKRGLIVLCLLLVFSMSLVSAWSLFQSPEEIPAFNNGINVAGEIGPVGDNFATARFSDISSEGTNAWVFHTPDRPGERNLYIAPRIVGGGRFDWDWGNQFNFAPDGTLYVKKICFPDGTCLTSASQIPTNPSGVCELGRQQCSAGGSIQVCTPTSAGSTEWSSVACGANQVCQMQGTTARCVQQNPSEQNPPPTTINQACDTAGLSWCFNPNVLRTCSSDRTKITEQLCVFGCADIAGPYAQGDRCKTCLPGVTKCSDNGNGLLTCTSDGVWPSSPQQCQFGCRTRPFEAPACNTRCRPGTTMCDLTPERDDVVVCNDRGDDYSVRDECGARGCNDDTNLCYPECKPGKVRCTPGNSGSTQTCNSEGRWGSQTDCSAGESCREVNGVGQCSTASQPTACGIGFQSRCDGDDLLTCSNSVVNRLTCQFGCRTPSFGAGAPACNTRCRPGTTMCDLTPERDDVVVCNDRGDDYSVRDECGARGCNDDTNLCYPECKPGVKGCVENFPASIKACNSQGRWDSQTPCSAGETCREVNGNANCASRVCRWLGVGGGRTCAQRCSEDVNFPSCDKGRYTNPIFWWVQESASCSRVMPWYGGECFCCSS